MTTKILFISTNMLGSSIIFIIVIGIVVLLFNRYIKKLKQVIIEKENKNEEYKELLTNCATSNKELLDEIVVQKQKNNEFISKVSREINTSVNGILGMTNLLKDTGLNTEQSKNADVIISCSETLLQNTRTIINVNTNQNQNINSIKQDVMNNQSPEKKGKSPVSPEFANEFPIKILIAEDDLINQHLASKMLNKLGYKPDIVSNGKEALEIVSEKIYDLILMDGLMPQMDGFEATRMIRLCLETQPIIIALTASTMYGDKEKCIQAGMDDYLSKPIDINHLAAIIEKWAVKKKVIV